MQSNDSWWEKEKPTDKIWWQHHVEEVIGEFVFSFDKVHEFNLFQDYPDKLTAEQKAIFDREQPYWADFFKDRTQK